MISRAERNWAILVQIDENHSPAFDEEDTKPKQLKTESLAMLPCQEVHLEKCRRHQMP